MTETDALPTTIAELGNALRNASAQEAAWRSHREALDRHLDVLLTQEPETARDTDVPAADAPVTRADAPAMRDQHAATIDRVTAEVRATALREAADAITPDVMGWGGPDHDDAWKAAEQKLRRMAAARHDDTTGGAR